MLKSRFLTLSTRFMLASALFMALIIGSAQTGLAAPLQAVPGYTVTIPAGGTGTIPVQALSLSPGSNVSSDALSLAAQPLAADNIRTALYYGIDWGYAETAPYQVALAVWWVQDNTWQDVDHATAEQIGTTAVNTPGTPGWNPDGVSLLSLLQSGQVSIAPLTLTPSAQYASLGSGSLQVTNTSANSINVFLPYGTVFGGPTTQTLVWASGEGSQGPAATPTNAPEATATVADPVAPSATQAVTGKGGGQPAAPTATATAKTVPGKGKTTPAASNTPAPPADTATPLPTATTEPTLAPTDTPQPAPTEAVANTGANTGIPSQQNSKAAGTTGSQSPESESVEAPSAPSGSAGQQNTTQEGKSQPGANAAGGAVAQPDGIMQGPVLPNATATPVGDSAGSAPPPVGTAGAPEAVTTSQPGVGAPNPQATGETFIPDAQATKDALVALATGTGVPTAVVKPTDVPPTAVVDTGSSDGAIPGDVPTVEVPPVDAQPTEETKATPAPTPVPAPNDGGATVDASSGDQSGASGDTSGSASADGGPVPSTNPATGGGRSDLTTWLGLVAALMMLGGWALRFKARAPVPVRAESTND